MAKKNGHIIEIIVAGSFPEKLKPFVRNPRCIKIVVPDLNILSITIPLINNNELVLKTKSMTGGDVSVNACLLGNNHVLAGDITLINGKSDQSLQIITKGKSELIRGEIVLIDFELIQKDITLANLLWKRYMKNLDAKDQEIADLSKDLEARYKKRIAVLMSGYNELQETVDIQNRDLLTKPQFYQSKLVNNILGAIIKEIETKTLSKEMQIVVGDLREELAKEARDDATSARSDYAEVDLNAFITSLGDRDPEILDEIVETINEIKIKK